MTGQLKAGDKLVLATHNPGKLNELRQLLEPHSIEVTSAGELGLPEPEETGTTFRANAEIKARAACEATELPSLADDSGIEVADLSGAPGVYSADWGGPSKDFAGAMQRVREELETKGAWGDGSTPVANFNATLAMSWPDGCLEFYEGKVFGTLVWPPRGDDGFGYDPMFQPEGKTKTFGEMTREEKSGQAGDGKPLSHRARALRLFIAACIEGAGSDA
ncbi:MAG: non-canonical purine NTP pyrophosphatase [Pseudomonadota bacterium]